MSTDKVKKSSLIGSAGTVSAATAVSRVFGLVREQVMAYYFGAGMATDAFVTAFRIPNLLRDLFAEGALSSAFVPVFKEKLVNDSADGAFRLASAVLSIVSIAVSIVIVLGIIAAPAFVYLAAHGFASVPEKFALTVSLTRIMFVFLLLVSVGAMVMGMLNSFGRFGIPALAPAMFNVGSVLTVVVLYGYLDQPVYALALGVIVGGAAQLAVQLPSLWRIGYRFHPRVSFFDEGVRKVLRLMGPMIIGLSAGRINILVGTLLASFLLEGSISYLNYAYRVMHFPLGVFAVALGTVALPQVSEMVARKDLHRLSGAFAETINFNMFVVVPSAVFLTLMGPQIVDVIYRWGAFSQIDSGHTTLALRHYAYGLIGFAAVRVTVPFFYAFGDSRLPMRISILSVVVNLVLYYPLMTLMKPNGFAGLAAATSIGGLVNFAGLVAYLPSRGVAVAWKKLGLSFVRVTAISLLAFYVALRLPYGLAVESPSLADRLLTLAVPAGVATVLFVLLCFLLRVPEIYRLRDFVVRKRPRRT